VSFICQRFAPESKRSGLGFRYRVFQNLCFSDTYKYRDLPADFADASLMALCERRKIKEVASVDSDFSIYRARERYPFRNLFLEGP